MTSIFRSKPAPKSVPKPSLVDKPMGPGGGISAAMPVLGSQAQPQAQSRAQAQAQMQAQQAAQLAQQAARAQQAQPQPQMQSQMQAQGIGQAMLGRMGQQPQLQPQMQAQLAQLAQRSNPMGAQQMPPQSGGMGLPPQLQNVYNAQQQFRQQEMAAMQPYQQRMEAAMNANPAYQQMQQFSRQLGPNASPQQIQQMQQMQAQIENDPAIMEARKQAQQASSNFQQQYAQPFQQQYGSQMQALQQYDQMQNRQGFQQQPPVQPPMSGLQGMGQQSVGLGQAMLGRMGPQPQPMQSQGMGPQPQPMQSQAMGQPSIGLGRAMIGKMGPQPQPMGQPASGAAAKPAGGGVI